MRGITTNEKINYARYFYLHDEPEESPNFFQNFVKFFELDFWATKTDWSQIFYKEQSKDPSACKSNCVIGIDSFTNQQQSPPLPVTEL